MARELLNARLDDAKGTRVRYRYANRGNKENEREREREEGARRNGKYD